MLLLLLLLITFDNYRARTYLEPREELLLAGYVGGEYERADLTLELGLVAVGKLGRDAALEQAAYC